MELAYPMKLGEASDNVKKGNNMPEISQIMQDHWIAVVGIVLSLVTLLWLYNPRNFTSVPLNSVGVMIAFGEVQSKHGPGPLYVPPWADLNVLPKGDITLKIDLPDLMLSGDSPVEVRIKGKVIVRFKDAMKVLMSTVDKNPLSEATTFIRAAFANAVKSKTFADALTAGIYTAIENEVGEALRGRQLFLDWGMEIRSVSVEDIDFTDEVRRALEKTHIARQQGEALKITAVAEAEAYQQSAQLMGETAARARLQGELLAKAARHGYGQQKTDVNVGGIPADIFEKLPKKE